MIEVHDLCRRYGAFQAVRDVSFAIGDREIVGLLGHNGAGKTTVMKMLTGYLEPDSGGIRIDGLDPAERRRETQRRIGYLPENCPLYPELTVLETLLFQAGLRGIPRDRQPAAIRRAVERTALGDKAGAAVGTLSRGYRQRLGVAQAILHEPPILILDEPTNGLDPSQIQHMRDLARELAASATLILSTHVLQEVEAVCERVLIMRGGRLALDSTLDALGHPTRLRVVLDQAPGIALPLLAGVPGIQEAVACKTGGAVDMARNAHPKGDGEDVRKAYPGSGGRAARDAHPGSGGTGERYCYALASADPAEVAPAVARAVAERGWNLHELTPERRELEALFGAVTLERMEETGHV